MMSPSIDIHIIRLSLYTAPGFGDVDAERALRHGVEPDPQAMLPERVQATRDLKKGMWMILIIGI